MSAAGTGSGIVLIILGMWLLLQTLVGGLASRIVGASTTAAPNHDVQGGVGGSRTTAPGSGVGAGGTGMGTGNAPGYKPDPSKAGGAVKPA